MEKEKNGFAIFSKGGGLELLSSKSRMLCDCILKRIAIFALDFEHFLSNNHFCRIRVLSDLGTNV
jgi:hypothetical protein